MQRLPGADAALSAGRAGGSGAGRRVHRAEALSWVEMEPSKNMQAQAVSPKTASHPLPQLSLGMGSLLSCGAPLCKVTGWGSAPLCKAMGWRGPGQAAGA